VLLALLVLVLLALWVPPFLVQEITKPIALATKSTTAIKVDFFMFSSKKIQMFII
jgi:hypothetical protein